MDGLANNHRLLSFDNPGIGGSAIHTGVTLTIEQMADDARYVEFAEAFLGLTIQHAAELNQLLADWVRSSEELQPRKARGS